MSAPTRPLLSLSLRTRPSLSRATSTPTASLHPLQPQTPSSFAQQTRHESTHRRSRKALNVGPAPVFGGPDAPRTGSSGRSHRPRTAPPLNDHIVFNPPPSIPNVYHTPAMFLPREDPRRKLFEREQRQSPSAVTTATSASSAAPDTNLPPRLFPPHVKKYHLGPAEIEEIRRLRTEDPWTWTRRALGKKFDCSPEFIPQITHASEEKKAAHRRAVKVQERKWGPRRRAARVERRRRAASWFGAAAS